MPEDNRIEMTEQRCGILAIGNLLVDKMHHIVRYPAESMLEEISRSATSFGGGVMNVLFDLAIVDPQLPLAAVGMVGRDEDGQSILDAFSERNIDASGVGSVNDQPTSFTHVMISEASATRTFFHSHGANACLDLSHVKGIGANTRIAHMAYLMLLNGLDRPNAVYGSNGAEALAILQQKGFRTSLDLVSTGDTSRYERFARPALRYTDYLIINDTEAASLLGEPNATTGPDVDWEAALKQAENLLHFGVGELVAIHFPQGAVAVSKAGETVVQPCDRVPQSDVVSSLGAGDAFCAGMLYGIHEQRSLDNCLKLGAALARFNLSAASATGGAVPLSQLENFITQTRA